MLWFDYLERLIICITPFIVGYFSWRTAVSQKKTKEFMELQAKYNTQQEEIKKSEAERQNQVIERMSQDIDSLRDQVDTLQKSLSLDSIKSQLSDVIELSNINFNYSQSLSQVICAIGDCIDKAAIGDTGSVAAELAKHKAQEREITNRLLKIVY